MTPILACASHMLVDLPLFGGPVVMVIGAARSERHRAGEQPARKRGLSV